MRATASFVVTTLLLVGILTSLPGSGNGLPVNAAAAQTNDPFGEPAPRDNRAPKARRAPADGAPRNVPPEPASKKLSPYTAIHAELGKYTTLDPVELPLQDLMTQITDLHRIPVNINARKLEEAGIQLTAPITKRVSGVRLSTALDVILDELDLAYVVQDEILTITTKEDAQSRQEIRVYDCSDLTAGPANRELSTRLINLITTNVDAWSWQQSSAAPNASEEHPRGAISEFEGMIVVTHNARTHQKLEKVIDMLREVAGRNVEARLGDRR